jgi:hypothetical protein
MTATCRPHIHVLLALLSVPLAAPCLLAQPAPAEPPTPQALLQAAQTEASRVRDPSQRALLLADVALAWRPHDGAAWEKTWAEALAAAETVPDPLGAALTWRGLAVRLWPIAPDRAQQLLDRATKAARELPYVAQKALALREIGRGMLACDAAQGRALLDEAAVAARAIQSPVFRAAALRDIAGALAEADRAAARKLLVEAVALLPPADPDESVPLARIEVVTVWCRLNLETALTEAALIGDPRLRETAYRRMCEALGPVNPDEALMIAGKIRDAGERALALAALAVCLGDNQPETAAAMAQTALCALDKLQGAQRDRLQADVAVALCARDAAEGLALLAKVEDEAVAAEAFKRIVVRVARTDCAAALRVLEGVQESQLREAALAEIMPALARMDPARAVAAAEQFLSRRDKVRALLAIAAVLTQPLPAEKVVTP